MHKIENNINKKNIDKVIKKILPFEQKCINLSALLKLQKFYFEENQKHKAFLDSLVIYEKSKNGEILGVIITSRMGVVLHCFYHCFSEKISKEIEAQIIKYFANGISPTSVMGDKENSDIIEELIFKALNKKPIQSEDYKLLTLCKNAQNNFKSKFYHRASENLNTNLKIFIPSPSEVEEILPLEIAYQIEEVLTINKSANEDFFRKVLIKYMTRKSLYAIRMQDKYVAKASINANGINWIQIGGVYTIPKQRNKGLGAAVIEAIVNDRKNQNKECALFVKTKNLPAINMYKKLGFQEYCNFQISYF